MKTLFDPRPLKQEAWLKCKDSLDSTHMSGLEAIVKGLEQVFRFISTVLKWRQEKDLTNAPNVTEDFTIHDDEAESSPSQEEEFFKDNNNSSNAAGTATSQDVTKDSAKDDAGNPAAPDVTTITSREMLTAQDDKKKK